MDFYKKINVDNLRNKIPSIPSMPTMLPLSNFQMPKMKSRKIFKSSKENPSPRHMAKAVSTTSLPPSLPPSSFIDRSPAHISTISSLKSNYNKSHFNDGSENNDRQDSSNYRSHNDCNEKNGGDTSLKSSGRLGETFSKHYKDFSEFKLKHIFSKKTVVRRTEIEVDMYAENYRMDLNAEEEEERRIFEQELNFEYKFNEECLKSSDSQESFNRSDSMTSVVPTPERSRINALQGIPAKTLSRSKINDSVDNIPKPKKRLSNMLWKSSDDVIDRESLSSSGILEKSSNLFNIRGNKSKNSSSDALDESVNDYESKNKSEPTNSSWMKSNFGFKKALKPKETPEVKGGMAHIENDVEHGWKKDFHMRRAHVNDIDEYDTDQKLVEEKPKSEEATQSGSKFWQPENGWRKPKFRFRKSIKEQQSIDADAIEKDEKLQSEKENVVPSRFWQPESGWRKPNLRFRKSLKAGTVLASGENTEDGKTLVDANKPINTSDNNEDVKDIVKPNKVGRGAKRLFLKKSTVLETAEQNINSDTVYTELPPRNILKTFVGQSAGTTSESSLLNKARVWKNKSRKIIKSTSSVPEALDKDTDLDSDQKSHVVTNKRVWKMKSLRKMKTLSREFSDAEIDVNDAALTTGQKPHKEGIYAKLKTLAKNPLNKNEADTNGGAAKSKQYKFKSTQSKDEYKSDVEEDNYESVESKPPIITKFWKKTKDNTLHDVTDEALETEDHSSYGKLKKWTFNMKDKSSLSVDIDNEPTIQQGKSLNLMDKLKTIRARKSQSCDEIIEDETPEEMSQTNKKLSNMEKIGNCKDKAKLKMAAQMEKIKNYHASKSKDSEDSTQPQHRSDNYFDDEDIREIKRVSPAQWAAQQNFAQSFDSLDDSDSPNIETTNQITNGRHIPKANITIRPVSPVPSQLASDIRTVSPISTFLAPPSSGSSQKYGYSTDWIPNRQIISGFLQNSPSVPSKFLTEIKIRGHARKQSIDSNDSDSWIPENNRNVKSSPVQNLNKIEEKYEPWKPQSLATDKKFIKKPSIDIFTGERSGAFEDFEDVMKNVPIMEINDLDDLPPAMLPPPPPPPTVSPPPPPLPKRKHNIPERTESMVNLAKPLIKQSSLRRRFSDSLDSDEFNFGVVNKLIEKFEKTPSFDDDNSDNNSNNDQHDDYDDEDYNDTSPEHIQVIAIIESKHEQQRISPEPNAIPDPVLMRSTFSELPTDIGKKLAEADVKKGELTTEKPTIRPTVNNPTFQKLPDYHRIELQLPDDKPPPPPTQPPPELDDDEADGNKIKNNNNNNNNNIPIPVARKHSTTKRQAKKKNPRPIPSINPIWLDENQNINITVPNYVAPHLPYTSYSKSSSSSQPCSKIPLTENTDTRTPLKMPLFVSGPLALPITGPRAGTGTRAEDDMFFSFESDEGITV